MKNPILLSLMFIAAASYGQTTPYIKDMMPHDRQVLSLAMIESAEAYEKAGNKKRAAEYRKGALAVFPIGDKAHILARTMQTNLDDNQTYESFIASADAALKIKNYRRAMVEYLMALELRQPIGLYEKLQKTYSMMGDKDNASSLQLRIEQAKSIQEAAPQAAAEGGYQAEAEESYPQEYPIDGYSEEDLASEEEMMPSEEDPAVILVPDPEFDVESDEEVIHD